MGKNRSCLKARATMGGANFGFRFCKRQISTNMTQAVISLYNSYSCIYIDSKQNVLFST